MQDSPADEHDTILSRSSSESSEAKRRGYRFAHLREEHWIGSPAFLGHPPCTPTSESMTPTRIPNIPPHSPVMDSIDLDAGALLSQNPLVLNDAAAHQAVGGVDGIPERTDAR